MYGGRGIHRMREAEAAPLRSGFSKRCVWHWTHSPSERDTLYPYRDGAQAKQDVDAFTERHAPESPGSAKSGGPAITEMNAQSASGEAIMRFANTWNSEVSDTNPSLDGTALPFRRRKQSDFRRRSADLRMRCY